MQKTVHSFIVSTAVMLVAFAASAETFRVTRLDDSDSNGTLRRAIKQANQRPGPDVIVFDVWGDILITEPLPELLDSTGGTLIDGTTSPAYGPWWGRPQPAVYLRGGGSGNGIRMTSSGNEVRALFIMGFANGIEIANGAAANRVTKSAIYRNSGNGILILDGSGNTIGGTEPSDANLIRENGAGVTVLSGTGNAILSNAIIAGGGLGIDLGADGPTPNDSGDADSGPNGLQNYPELALALVQPNASFDAFGWTNHAIRVWGVLESAANAEFKLQLFLTVPRLLWLDQAAAIDGQEPVGQTLLTTDSAGRGSVFGEGATMGGLRYEYGQIVGIVPECITATATDSAGNTSEFGSGAFARIDQDGDGIADEIDRHVSDGSEVSWKGIIPAGTVVDDRQSYSSKFSTVGLLGSQIAGEIVNANGLLLGVTSGWALSEGGNPGVVVAAAGPSNVSAELALSCSPGTVEVAGGTIAIFDCGSLIVDLREGRIRVPLTGGANIVAGRASKVKVVEFAGENFAVKNNSSAALVSITSESGPPEPIEPGGFRVVGLTAVPVRIDVKPGELPNPINLRAPGGTPVAIFGSVAIDVRQIILSTIELERAPVMKRRNGDLMAAIGDIDDDGFPDLVVHVVTSLIDASAADPDVALVAKTSDGKTLIGMDLVKLTPR